MEERQDVTPPWLKASTLRQVIRISSRSHYSNNFPSIPETTGQPDHCLSRHTFRLIQAVLLTGTSPVTLVVSPVTVTKGAVRKWVTGAVFLMTGRGPVLVHPIAWLRFRCTYLLYNPHLVSIIRLIYGL